METIESLDLSHNSLSGSIPHEMIRLSSLSTFSVAFNNLSGMIPYGGQFSTFLKSIYEGNPGLCGMPLEKACSTKKDGAKKMIEDGENKGNCKDLNAALFYSLVTVSFSLGFSGFLASVYFNMSWRRKYFKIIDEYYNMYLSNI
ncbi:unnamed protein product [Spirodela intermedia]|uniref:Uncharacterized protein n=1 Tax=Spirodela intermedia TaxID=51605 RepID=A0A7I8JPL8_SPIIN|nr:unnamed protein product [Spirodela intermedia]CAA6672128.1 unnamed protein product [Spirodela intermedia]